MGGSTICSKSNIFRGNALELFLGAGDLREQPKKNYILGVVVLISQCKLVQHNALYMYIFVHRSRRTCLLRRNGPLSESHTLDDDYGLSSV